ncbi:TetR family transcriptional regulator [Vreelandella aquamarina]|uniref:TetR family transcriptional regulator n=2 Tax=Vreelandella aquamarina TaxID=77097 RepID=A0A6F8XEB5_9GAMM|nr:TetR family transcriptional regulator [Halomonas meridiana]
MINVGVRLIIERGPQQTTLKDVGELAGYSRGLASHRFGSKDGLFQEILSQGRKQWAEELRRLVGERRGIEALLAATEAMRSFLTRSSDQYRAMLILWHEASGNASPLVEKLREHHEIQRRDVRRWIEQGIAQGDIIPTADPDFFAALATSMFYGTAYQWHINPQAFDLEQLFSGYRQAFETLLRAS